ncbi:retrovirus-related pol polyprotein from transposon TNT 1-94 [Tanacetum coccineum]
MKESKAYKTYLGYATGAVPPKIAKKFKKASLSKKDSDLVPVDEEPIKRGKRLKTPAKKSTSTPPAIALTEEAQMKEVRKKSLRDFHKTHPSGSGMVAKKPPRVDKITPTGYDEDNSNNKQESSNESSKQENESEEKEYDSKQVEEEEAEDDDQEEKEFVHNPSPTDDKDDDNLESKSDEEKGMDDTTYQFNDDVDVRLKEPTQTDKEVIKGEGADARMNDAQQRNENLETKVIDDAHVTISTVTKNTEVPITSSSRSSDLASKFLNFSDIPHADTEIVSPLDVHVHHEVPRTQVPTFLTIPVSVITESSPVFTNIPQSSQTYTPPPIPTTNAVSPVQEAAALRNEVLADSPVLTSIDQDAPSKSIPSSQELEHSLIISQGFEESPKTLTFHDDLLNESPQQDSTSHGSSSNVRQIYTPLEHLGRWSKNHPISNMIGDPSRSDYPSHVYKLKKALYDLKQAPRAWYDMLSSFLISQQFSKGAVDPTLFTRHARNDILQVQIYVDDIIFASTNTAIPRGIFINQSKYASEIVKKFGLHSTDSVDTPMIENKKLDKDLHGKQVDATYRGMIGSLMYLTASRPDLNYAVCLCARWSLKKQKSTAISSIEAEYIALSGCCAQILWMCLQLTDYGFQFNKVPQYCDNKSAIALCCNNVQHLQAKHIDVRYHFINEQVENGIVELYFVRTEYKLADIFTKPLPKERFNFLIKKLDMRSPETLKILAEETGE